MKLKKLLKYTDSFVKIRLWYADTPNEKFSMWEGYTDEVPKKFKKYQLITKENNNGCEAIYPFEDGFLRVTIVKEQNDEIKKSTETY